jgi:hypothetical protein
LGTNWIGGIEMTNAPFIKRSDVMDILNKHLNGISKGDNAVKHFSDTYEEIENLPTKYLEV